MKCSHLLMVALGSLSMAESRLDPNQIMQPDVETYTPSNPENPYENKEEIEPEYNNIDKPILNPNIIGRQSYKTPYTKQTQSGDWEAGVPDHGAWNGYQTKLFPTETEAYNYVVGATGAKEPIPEWGAGQDKDLSVKVNAAYLTQDIHEFNKLAGNADPSSGFRFKSRAKGPGENKEEISEEDQQLQEEAQNKWMVHQVKESFVPEEEVADNFAAADESSVGGNVITVKPQVSSELGGEERAHRLRVAKKMRDVMAKYDGQSKD